MYGKGPSAHKVYELLSRAGKQNQMWAGEMVPWMKAVTIKPENMSSSPGNSHGGSCPLIFPHVPGQCMYVRVHK